MQQMMPEKPERLSRQEPNVSSKLEASTAQRKPVQLPPPLLMDTLEARLLAISGHGYVTANQRKALDILIEIDLRQRKVSENRPWSRGVHACYSVVNQLDRPSIRCDASSPSLGHVVDHFPIDRLGWKISRPNIELALSEAVHYVGRIEPERGSHRKYLGSGFLVRASPEGNGIVMTNWHVVRAMQNSAFGWEVRGGKIIFDAAYYVDFDGSETRNASARARVVGARANPTADKAGTARLDVALLEVDLRPALEAGLLSSEALSGVSEGCLDLTTPDEQIETPLVVVGFPLRSGISGLYDGVDWDMVIGELFGYDLGFKRAAPGLLTRPAGSFSITQDPDQWLLGHDASTLKGSSGSPVFAADGSGVFGIHFSGWDMRINHAHSLKRAAPILKQMDL